MPVREMIGALLLIYFLAYGVLAFVEDQWRIIRRRRRTRARTR